eukprot:scpid84950/ scgid12173/ 
MKKRGRESYKDVSKLDVEPEEDMSEPPPKKRPTRKSLPLTDFTLCLLCQRTKMVDKYTQEKTSRVEMDTGVERLVQAARTRGDKRVSLAIEDGDLDFFAAEVRYHPSCYRTYTKKSTLEAIMQERDDPIDEATATALQQLMTYMEEIEHHAIVSLAQLATKLITFQAELGSASSEFTRPTLKRRILAHFGDRVEFTRHHAANGSCGNC